MCQNAVALQEDMGLALGLLLGPIDRISPEGQLTDMYDDVMVESLMVKPPMHGWAVKQIMKRHDLLKEWPREDIEKLYAGMGAWADWFMAYRDEDGDGLPSVIHSDETGLDVSTLFIDHLQITTPDLSAYLVLLFEAVGDLGKLLEKPESETNAWHEKSAGLLRRMIDVLWDGERFMALVPRTGEKLFSANIVHYMPAILGDRLPEEIIDKLADRLDDASTFMSPWGLASEEMTSDLYSPTGFGRGCILPPAMIYICTGLWDTHRRESAKTYAENYCTALKNSGFPFFIDPKTGGGQYYGCSWTYCAYAILAHMLNE